MFLTFLRRKESPFACFLSSSEGTYSLGRTTCSLWSVFRTKINFLTFVFQDQYFSYLVASFTSFFYFPSATFESGLGLWFVLPDFTFWLSSFLEFPDFCWFFVRNRHHFHHFLQCLRYFALPKRFSVFSKLLLRNHLLLIFVSAWFLFDQWTNLSQALWLFI